MTDIKQLGTKSVGEAAKYITAFRLILLGAEVTLTQDRKNTIIAKPKGKQREIKLRVKSRRSGSWQIPITEGVPPDGDVDKREFWILVDFSKSPTTPDFYIMPGKWLRNDIYTEHQEYLSLHGGERPVTPTSKHHRVTSDRIEQWKERWSILNL